MSTSLILSRLRVEIRLKSAGYDTEKNILRWVKMFFEEMSINDSSQIRLWQKDAYLSRLKNRNDISYEEILQARSSLLYLYKNILQMDSKLNPIENNTEDKILRITG